MPGWRHTNTQKTNKKCALAGWGLKKMQETYDAWLEPTTYAKHKEQNLLWQAGISKPSKNI